ncbi:putative nuclease HARBI1 [Hyperolius riggenbachi]|uniref:putative nuclease HARBI1 n=1 Tax=Hyperolius riggenbachi TaxID=752182 RepID=UPI0035A2C31B
MDPIVFLFWMNLAWMGVFLYYSGTLMRSRVRRWWVHPLLQERQQKGQFSVLYQDLRKHPVKFFKYSRMSVDLFDHLLTILRPHLLKKDTRMRKAITPEEQLMITLRFLATGQSYGSLHLTFRVGKSTISAIVNRTSRAIWCSLVAKYMPVPDSRKWAEIADLYWNRCNFPNCLGAIDGKHVRLQKPARSGSLYFNYKKYFSLVLLAVADADYNFIYVDVGSYGGSSDSGIFQRSRLHRLLNDDKLDIPGDKPWPGTTSPSYPYVFVGDEAFALSQHVMRPFGQRGTRREKRVFNYRLTRARRMVECTFGIMSNKWRMFHTPLQLSPTNATAVVKAACILHNFVRQEEGYNIMHLDQDYLPGIRRFATRGRLQAQQNRDYMVRYFMSREGHIQAQDIIVPL